MKKTIKLFHTVLLILAVFMILTLAACSNKEDSPSTKAQSLGQAATTTAGQFPGASTTKTELIVRNMRCNNCVNAIRKELRSLEGVITVSMDLRAKRVTVEHVPALSVDTIRKRIIEAGFNVN